MQAALIKILEETAHITLLVLCMMVAVDVINVWTHGKIALLLKQGRQWKQ